MSSKSDKKWKAEDTAWATAIKARDKACVWCGSTSRLAADHIFSRKRLSTRWELDNGVALCCGCHLFKKRFEPMEWALVVLERVGKDRLMQLLTKHKEKADAI